MSIQVTIDGLDTEVDVSLVPQLSDLSPETYVALRGLKGDKGDDGNDGADGVGITSITQNEDGTFSITLDDGTSYVTESLKGADGYTPVKGVDYFDGEDGADGYTPVKGVDYFDGANGTNGQDGYTPVKGVDYFDGTDGEDGVGIASVTKTGTIGLTDTYTITLTNGATTTFQVTNGSRGEKGEDGEAGNGIESAVLNADYTLTLTFTDGTSYTTPSIRGEKGEKGEAGDVDTAMSDSSTLPVQNNIIKAYVDGGLASKADSADIPTKVSDLTNDSGFINGNTGGLFYGTCSTVAGTVAKVVECADFTSDNLKAGAIIIVTFTATNSGAVANLTMNVNSTGAKPIKYINNGTLGNLSSAGYLKADTKYPFYYDGANWVVWFNHNATYSAIPENEMQTGTSTSARLITAQRLKQAIQYHAPVTSVNEQTGDVTISVPTKTSDLTNDSGFITGYIETDPTVPSWAKASTKPTYTASEVGALPDSTAIPSTLSDLTNDMSVSDFANDAGYLTSYTETGIIEFDETASSGDDHDLTQVLTSLGWLNDVIV